MNVFENVFVAAAAGGRQKGEQAYQTSIKSLELCGMTHLANRQAETLGLVDRKRLESARALATGQKVLLLNEIGGGLTDAEASNWKRRLVSGRTGRDRASFCSFFAPRPLGRHSKPLRHSSPASRLSIAIIRRGIDGHASRPELDEPAGAHTIT